MVVSRFETPDMRTAREKLKRTIDKRWDYVLSVQQCPSDDGTMEVAEFQYKLGFQHGHEHGVTESSGGAPGPDAPIPDTTIFVDHHIDHPAHIPETEHGLLRAMVARNPFVKMGGHWAQCIYCGSISADETHQAAKCVWQHARDYLDLLDSGKSPGNTLPIFNTAVEMLLSRGVQVHGRDEGECIFCSAPIDEGKAHSRACPWMRVKKLFTSQT